MLIKSVTKDGTAIPLTPEEALTPAVAIGLSTKNNSEFIFWTHEKAHATSLSSHPKDDGGYEAFAEGTCVVGKTRVKDDQFFDGKPHTFKIHYGSSKDEIGAPHVAVTSFEMSPMTVYQGTGASQIAQQPAPAKAEGGRISSKQRKY